MASQRCPPNNGTSTIKYWWIPPEVQSFEPEHIVLDGNLCATPTFSKKGGPLSGRDSSKRITISHFRSAAAGIWDCVGQPANLQAKSNCRYDNFYEKGSILFHMDSEKNVPEVCADTKIFGKYFECGSQLPPTAKSNFEDLRRIKKMLLFASCNRNINSFFFQSTPFLPEDANKIYKAASIGSSGNTASKTVSVNLRPFFGLTYLMKFTRRGCQAMDESCVSEGGPPSDLSDTQRAGNILKVQNNDLSNISTDMRKYEKNSPSSLCSAYTLQPSSCTEEAISILRQPTSGLQLNRNIELISSRLDSNEKSEKSTNSSSSSSSMVSESSVKASSTNYHNSSERDRFFGTISLMGEFSKKPWLDIQNKLQHAFSNNRHAIAGALAGTLVTLCLHPVDTVKTNIQAYGMGQKSFYHILKRIVSQNGMLGLYRGIASNITAAAPISAIYTFTYEYVKYALLPLLPKEYHSFAHCIAGGCSSIATSFIFTPSEHIKQQMQVGSQYQNCWNAFIGCLQKGGIPSLYAGWGAVLCRNIPHSIIKFYTYESLKQFLSSGNPDSNLNTFQTLVCGGLAGSTAALFTTPFDVVKTRLQTQAPGSVGNYHGVFHALQEIARQEGLQGLYRGLTPRLAMYVSQGAIFFASYEFLKAVFLLETPKNSAKIMGDEVCANDPATKLQMLLEK